MTKSDAEYLREFYRNVLEWIDSDFTNQLQYLSPQRYAHNYGLCALVRIWAYRNGLGVSGASRLESYQQLLFKENGLDNRYPFNLDGDAYLKERADKHLYKNPMRLNWIKDHAA